MKTRHWGNPENFFWGGYFTRQMTHTLQDENFNFAREHRWRYEAFMAQWETPQVRVGSIIQVKLPQRWLVREQLSACAERPL